MPKITIVCKHCESDNVMRDAYAMWSVEEQRWTLAATYDVTWCVDCDGESTLIEKEIPNA
jgi:hypothetical protein